MELFERVKIQLICFSIVIKPAVFKLTVVARSLLLLRMLQNRGLSSQPGLLEKILELKETHCSPYLLAFLFDCYEDVLESSVQKENANKDKQKETLRKALEVSV